MFIKRTHRKSIEKTSSGYKIPSAWKAKDPDAVRRDVTLISVGKNFYGYSGKNETGDYHFGNNMNRN